MNEADQNIFWKLIFFFSSVTFCGFFVSLPASVAIIAMIHLNCLAHSMVRRRLGHQCLGVFHMPIFGAMSVHTGFVLQQKENFLVAIAGPISGLVCSIIFCVYSVLLGANEFGEIARILIILNVINLLPMTFMDGSQICRSIGFSNSKFLGYLFLIMGCLAAYTMTYYSFFFFILWAFCMFDFRALVFHLPPSREMSRRDQFISIFLYSVIIAIFALLYEFVNEFQGTGAMDPFMLSKGS
jgi:Zn-dependent protease